MIPRVNIIEKIIMRIVKSVFIFFFIIFSSIDADTRETNQEVIQAILSYENSKDTSELQKVVEKELVIGKSALCDFLKTESYPGIEYFKLNCSGKSFSNFLFRGNLKTFNEYFQIQSFKIIGSKPFFEIKPSSSFKPNSSTLQIFSQIYKFPLKLKTMRGSEIFFDASCPLKFNKIEHDYYWDKKIFYIFSISCIHDTTSSLVYLEADENGKILVGKNPVSNIKTGELFLAKLKLRSVNREKIKWEPVFVYPY